MSTESPHDAEAPGPSMPWFRTLTAKVVGGIGVVLVGVVTTVLSTSVNDRVNVPPATRSPSAAVTVDNPTTSLPPIASSTTASSAPTRKAYAGPVGTGWSVSGRASRMSGDLLTLTASMDPGDVCHGGAGWLFAQRAADLEPLGYGGNVDAWAVRNGGAPAAGNFVTVDVQARQGHPVIIDAIGVRVVSRAAPASRSWPQLTGGCGGLTPSFFAADLDRGTGVRAVVGQDENGKTVEPVPLPHQLDDANPSEQWRIELVTTTCRCDVVPFFRYTSGGQEATIDITNRGGAWRVSPTRGSALVTREGAGGQWTAYGTAH